MKSNLSLLSAISFIFVGCFAHAALPRPSQACPQPTVDVNSEIRPKEMVAPSGNWILKGQSAFIESRFLPPTAATLRTLDFDMRRQLDERIAEVTQASVAVNFSKLKAKTVRPGNVKVPFVLACTTIKPAQNIKSNGNTVEESSNQDLNWSAPFLLNAVTLQTDLTTSSSYQLINGKKQKFAHKIEANYKPGSLLDIEKDAEKIRSAGLAIKIYKTSATSVTLRFLIEKINDGDLNLAHSSESSINGMPGRSSGSSHKLTLPVQHIMIVDSHFELQR